MIRHTPRIASGKVRGPLHREIRLAGTGSVEEGGVRNFHRVRRLAVTLSILLLVSSCGAESVIALGAGLASFVHTDQVPTDYIAERASGKQCDLLKSLEYGGPLCRNTFERRIIEKPIYCYRTIGKPTCYATPDPYGTGATQIR